MIDFPNYQQCDSLTSLSTLCMHVLCRSVKMITEGCKHLSPLYDENAWNKDKSWAEDDDCESEELGNAPKRFLEVLFEHKSQSPLLDINSREAILNYILREDILIRAEFILYLLKDGGVYNLDLNLIYSLLELGGGGGCDSDMDMEKIFVEMCATSNVIQRLAIDSELIDEKVWKKLKSVNFPNLKNLYIDDQFGLEFPLECCPNLIELNTENFDQISKCLKSKKTMFQSVIDLHISSFIEEEEILFCLANLPKIVVLRTESIIKFLKFLEQLPAKHSPKSTRRQLLTRNARKVLANLCHLTVEERMASSNIELLLKVCPNLQELSLNLCDGMQFQKLSQASKLQKLKITTNLTSSSWGIFTFDRHVVPLLKEIGNQLTELIFSGFHVIGLADCARLCPNLESLAVERFDSLGSAKLLLTHQFTQLKCLRLIPTNLVRTKSVSFLLMGAQQLEHVFISGADYLSDKELESVNALNPLKMLKTFVLDEPKSVRMCSSMATLLSASLSCGNLVYHNCGLTGDCLALSDGTIVNRFNYYSDEMEWQSSEDEDSESDGEDLDSQEI